MKFRTPRTFSGYKYTRRVLPDNTYIMTSSSARPRYKSRSCYSREGKAVGIAERTAEDSPSPSVNAIPFRGRGRDNGVWRLDEESLQTRTNGQATNELAKCPENQSVVLWFRSCHPSAKRDALFCVSLHILLLLGFYEDFPSFPSIQFFLRDQQFSAQLKLEFRIARGTLLRIPL